jgi:hypothetical protein
MDSLLALSIRQPWAWLVAHGYKDIENRDWQTHVRGWVLVHAAGRLPAKWDWSANALFAAKRGVQIPCHRGVELGCLVGVMRIDDCVTTHSSRWFTGPYGFVIGRAAAFLAPVSCAGSLKYFRIDSLQIQSQARMQLRAVGLEMEVLHGAE